MFHELYRVYVYADGYYIIFFTCEKLEVSYYWKILFTQL